MQRTSGRGRRAGLAGVVSFALTSISIPAMVSGQETTPLCYYEEPSVPIPRTIEAFGQQRAVLIFARFPDGEDVGEAGNPIPECPNCGDGWTGSGMPSWSDDLLEDITNPTGSPLDPVIPGSLSHFFDAMSLGQHTLGGVEYGVYTAEHPLVWYAQNYGTQNFTAIRQANKDILIQWQWECTSPDILLEHL